jgi:hypothetical protein
MWKQETTTAPRFIDVGSHVIAINEIICIDFNVDEEGVESINIYGTKTTIKGIVGVDTDKLLEALGTADVTKDENETSEEQEDSTD